MLQRVRTPSRARSTVLVVDDHGIFREGLVLLLESQRVLDVVGSVRTGNEAIQVAKDLRPDLIIMDLALPDLNGIDVSVRILHVLPLTRIIMLSGLHTSEYVHRALRAGIRGYVIKDAAGVELAQAIGKVLAGGEYVGGGLAYIGDNRSLGAWPTDSPIERLSMREREILQSVCTGLSSAEIGRILSLSRKTVDTYRSRLMSKLGVRNRVELIRFAIEHGLSPG